VNFLATDCGFLLDFTLFKKFRSLSWVRGPFPGKWLNDVKHSSRISSHWVESESEHADALPKEDGVEVKGVLASNAWETVGVCDRCIGEQAFLAIFRTGEGVVNGTSRDDGLGDLSGDCFRFVTASE